MWQIICFCALCAKDLLTNYEVLISHKATSIFHRVQQMQFITNFDPGPAMLKLSWWNPF